MEEAFNMKTKEIELLSVLFDQHYFDRAIYLARENRKEIMIQIRPFANFNTHAFNDILY